MQTIGDRLKQIREKARLKQKDLAEMFGLKMPGYNRIEKDKVDLTLKHLKTLKAKFHISLDWLITGKQEKSDIDGFDQFTGTVKQMVDDMRQDPAFMHAVLSHYHELKEKRNKEQERKSLEKRR